MPKQPVHSVEESRRIGARIANVRKSRGVSQAALGEIIGVSYQQVGKYETGLNSIPIDRLRLFCETMNVPISAILPTEVDAGPANAFADWLDKPGAVEMLELFAGIESPDNRKMALNLVRTMREGEKS